MCVVISSLPTYYLPHGTVKAGFKLVMRFVQCILDVRCVMTFGVTLLTAFTIADVVKFSRFLWPVAAFDLHGYVAGTVGDVALIISHMRL